jgi:hypothetical protein
MRPSLPPTSSGRDICPDSERDAPSVDGVAAAFEGMARLAFLAFLEVRVEGEESADGPDGIEADLDAVRRQRALLELAELTADAMAAGRSSARSLGTGATIPAWSRSAPPVVLASSPAAGDNTVIGGETGRGGRRTEAA